MSETTGKDGTLRRRDLVALMAATGVGLLTTSERATGNGHATSIIHTIDRRALVDRHKIVLIKPDFLGVLSVGNGDFTFNVDITGLQTFESQYNQGIPLATLSNWGWHHVPNPHHYSLAKFPLSYFENCGRLVGYLYCPDSMLHMPKFNGNPVEWAPAANYLYSTPGRLDLGRIGLILKNPDGSDVQLGDLTDIRQELDLWTGCITSHFAIHGIPVLVTTTCHGEKDQIAVRVESPLAALGRLQIFVAFPYASCGWGGNGAEWNTPDAYQTTMVNGGDHRANFICTVGRTVYHAALQWKQGAHLKKAGPHRFVLQADEGVKSLEFVCAFSPQALPTLLPDAAETRTASALMLGNFWSTGGAIDLSSSSDPRWKELERRIVLSQYLTRIQSAGRLPPQETGLTCNSWYGKFHLEMHWWHCAHFALWGRDDILARSLTFYQRIWPQARAIAHQQGFPGFRWPKCVGPAGIPAPNYIECFLIWQQPHQMFYAELCYRAHPNAQTLALYKDRVLQTADFLAAFLWWRPKKKQYQLGPPVADAAEIYFPEAQRSWNPTFELAYWQWALSIAQTWRARLGLPPHAKWAHILSHLPPLATRNGLYVAGETATETFTKPGYAVSHPCLLAPLGMLDGAMVDRATMQRTLKKVMQVWNWGSTWGWDFPLIAMTAAITELAEGPHIERSTDRHRESPVQAVWVRHPIRQPSSQQHTAVRHCPAGRPAARASDSCGR